MDARDHSPNIVPAWFGLAALTLAAALTVLLSLFPIHSFDLWWHLRTGELIVEEGRIPTADPFTFTAQGRPWVTHEWLSEVLFFRIYEWGGLDLLIVLKALACGLAVLLAAWAGSLSEAGNVSRHLSTAAAAVLLAGPLLAPRAFVRPHILTALCLGLTLLLLRLGSRTGKARFRWLLIPLFVLWANLHSGFLLGLGLVFLYWLGEQAFDIGSLGRPGRTRQVAIGYALPFALIALSTLINPHHIEALLYPLRLLERAEVRDSIAELRNLFHPAYRGALFIKVLAVAVLTLGLLLFTELGRWQWALVLPAIVFLGTAVVSVRGVSEFAVVFVAAFAAHGARLGEKRSVAWIVTSLVVVTSLAGAAGALTWGQPMGREENRRVGVGINPVNRPDIAVRFMKEVAPPGRAFNLLGFGGYLIHELWPERHVFIDGRLDVFPPGFLREYNRLVATGDGWDEMVAAYDLRYAIVDYSSNPRRDQGLRSRLREDPRWHCVCFGDNVLIYARQCAENTSLLAEYGLVFDPSLRHARSIDGFVAEAAPVQVQRTIQALERIAMLAPEQAAPSYVLGRMLLVSGRGAAAADHLRRAADREASLIDARQLLAQALLEADSLEACRRELNRILRAAPYDGDALLVLAEVERRSGNPQRSAEYLRQILSIDPRHFAARLRLGIMQAELGDLRAARQSLEAARRLRPSDPAVLKNLRILDSIEEAGPR